MKTITLKGILYGLSLVLKHSAKTNAKVKKHIGNRECKAQIRLKDSSIGRSYIFDGSKIKTSSELLDKPDVEIIFSNLATALEFLNPKVTYADIIHAAKNFRGMNPCPFYSPISFFHILT